MKWVQHAARFPIRQYRLQYQACLTRVSAAIFKAFGMRARAYTGPNVSMVKRGKWNAEKNAMQELLRPFTMDLTCNSVEETEVDVVVDAIKAVIVSDGDDAMDMFSVAAFLESIKEEEEAAQAVYDPPPAAAKAVDTGPKAVPYINFEESVAELRQPSAPRNWMLCALIK